MPNRLAQETSPYLLQHKDNPVDWYPWGEEALARAKAENKPILLSVGYSACHWCHVMAHESFEDDETARRMNENFINIKVDREERPDLDQIYQNVAQAMTRGGGWPLTVFLTPELKPFYGGTYFPPTDLYGRPGFPRLLSALTDAFKNDHASISENAEKLTALIQSVENLVPTDSKASPDLNTLQIIAQGLLNRMDWENGGIGGAPKFPNVMLLAFLWRISQTREITVAREAEHATLLTLRKMASGGLYDHLGGGFHRYCVDATWSVPHFEKMLYDNGLLLKIYAEVLLSQSLALTTEDRELFLNVLLETVAYVDREMTFSAGGFFSAQDADSDGEEGKFFVWDPADLKRELSDEEGRVFALAYGVKEEGNFEKGATVLHLDHSITVTAKLCGMTESHVHALLDSAKSKLLQARVKRIAPGLDDKILTSWNGLMISGLAWAAQALHRAGGQKAQADRARQMALRAFHFLVKNVSASEGRLFSTYQKGEPKLNAYLDDYAFLAMAALDLARFSESGDEVERDFLAHSSRWIDAILKHFKDKNAPGYFFTSDDHEKLIQRPKTVFDQAIPSGTAVTLTCMTVLSETDVGGRAHVYAQELETQLGALFALVEANPYGFGEMLCLSLLNHFGPVVVTGTDAFHMQRHAHIFQKPLEDGSVLGAGEILVCHLRTCSLPLSFDEAWAQAHEKVGLKTRIDYPANPEN